MEIFYATTNAGKIYNLRRIVRDLPLEIVTPGDLGIKLEVEEDGDTAVENAAKKARAYHELVGRPTLAGDSALYIEGLPSERQPGLRVRRVGGKELSDEETIEYYAGLIREYGGPRDAWYVTGLALLADGHLHTVEIEEDRFALVAERDQHPHRVSPLDVLSIELSSGKYYSALGDDELSVLGQKFDAGVLDFLGAHLL